MEANPKSADAYYDRAKVLLVLNRTYEAIESLKNSFQIDPAKRKHFEDEFPGVKSIKDVRAAVQEKVKDLKPGEWIRGRGWNEDILEECKAEKRFPSRKDLDDITPNNPVVFIDFNR